MDVYLNMSIKELIDRFPEVGAILNEHGVGCVSCGVGTCLLKDIIEVHGLSEEEEKLVMDRIAAVIYPGAEVEIPRVTRKAAPTTGSARLSPPMRLLVEEHVLIKRFITLIPDLVRVIDLQSAADQQLVLDGVDFIRSYGDRFHHAKEEDILFNYFDESQPIIKAMLDDHQLGRAHARAVAEAVERRDKNGVAEHLRAYGELLSGHIKREDEILYPWMDRNLETTQVGELFSRFQDTDQALGREVTEKYCRFVEQVEEITRKRKEGAI